LVFAFSRNLDILLAMSRKTKKPSNDRIFVRGGGGPGVPTHRPTNHDDIALLALQLACPKRWEHGENPFFDNLTEVYNLTAITVETRLFSSLIVVGTSSASKNIEALIQPLKVQLYNIIKSAHEKIYFIEHFNLGDPKNLEWDFFLKMSDYCFLQESVHGSALLGYFRLEKTNDEERFATKSVDSMGEGEVAEQDVYLYFQKNNRYIKILKKGEALEKSRKDRLQSRGVTDFYITADQGLETQQRRIRHIILELLEDYATLVNAA
jgi:hypothetical protein